MPLHAVVPSSRLDELGAITSLGKPSPFPVKEKTVISQFPEAVGLDTLKKEMLKEVRLKLLPLTALLI
jgi:hypothetical protein